MALEYFKYITTYGNTLVDRSNTSFAPVPPYGQIYIDYFIPQSQPLYLYANSGGSGGTIIVNTQANIDAYLGASEPPPTADGNVTYGQFTGTTTALSATTTALETSKLNTTTFASYTGTTVPNTYYNKTQINSYSAGTLTNINSRLLTTIYSNYTGTTVPNTYYNKTQINSYSANTLTNINSRLLTTIYSNYTGTTAPAKYASRSFLSTYTGTTAPATFASKSFLSTYTGTTAPTTFASKSFLSTYTGTTVPNTYYSKAQINSYSASTQTAINGKQATITGAATSITGNNLTINRAVISNASGKVAASPTTSTQIGYLSGATSDVQTQINATFCQLVNLGTDFCIGSTNGRCITLKSLKPGSGIAMSCNANTLTVCATGSVQPIMVTDKQILFASGGTITGSTRLLFCYPIDSFSMGRNSVASGSASFAINGGQSIGLNSFADGASNSACAPYSTIIGGSGNTICSGALRSTVIGSCGIVLTGSGYNDFTAVGGLAIWNTPPSANSQKPTLFWNSTTKKVEARQLTGGSSNYHYVENLNNSTTTSTTCVKFLGYTASTFQAGRYQVDMTSQFGNSTSNACTLVALKFDGNTIGSVFLNRVQAANWNSIASTTRDATLTAGTHCFEIWFWAGTGTACMSSAAIRAKLIC